MMRGDVMEGGPSAASPSNPAGGAGTFGDLLREARVRRSFLRAFPGRRMAFGNRVSFRTASSPAKGRSVTLTVESAAFRPPRDVAPAAFEVVGGIAGEVEQGSLSFPGSRAEPRSSRSSSHPDGSRFPADRWSPSSGRRGSRCETSRCDPTADIPAVWASP